MPATQIWHKQKNETTEAFEAFKVYRDMPPRRSYKAVSQKLKKQIRLIQQWGAAHNWQERVEAYDLYRDQSKEQAEIKGLEKAGIDWGARQLEHRSKEWELSLKLQARAEKMLKYPLFYKKYDKNGKTVHVHPVHWTAADITHYIETADKLARLASELPTEFIAFLNLLDTMNIPASEVFEELINQFKDLKNQK